MNYFGIKKSLTSAARWILHWASFLIYAKKIRFLLISPPIFKRQLVFDYHQRSFFSFTISSYSDWATAYHVFAIGEYDLKKVGLAEKIQSEYEKKISNRPVILDLGANIGLTSLYYSRLYPEAQIIGVELDLNNFNLAKKNLSRTANVRLEHAAISAQGGTGYIADPGLGNNAYRLSLDPDSGGKEIRTISVNAILHDVEAFEILIAKIDIEGSERHLFDSDTEWVAKTKLIVMETHDWLLPGQSVSRGFIQAISGANRDFLHRGENVYSFLNE